MFSFIPSLISENMKVNKISLSGINRRNIFGENLLYKAALWNDVDLVHHCIKTGGNVNQPSYAGKLRLPPTVILEVVWSFRWVTPMKVWQRWPKQVSNRKFSGNFPTHVALHHLLSGKWYRVAGAREEVGCVQWRYTRGWVPEAGLLPLLGHCTVNLNFEWKRTDVKSWKEQMVHWTWGKHDKMVNIQ